MKRIHLFEFEDFNWFPNWLRICMTRYIVAFHKLLGTGPVLAELVKKALQYNPNNHIIDLCSGSGGPMPDVARILKEEHHTNVQLTLTDLYPNTKAAKKFNNNADSNITYETSSVDATQMDRNKKGVRTMICSMHHMKPKLAHAILKNAKEAKQPICVYEISDNAPPIFLWWIAIPFSFLMVFFITPLIRPMSWQQLVFTYIIPLLPLFIAWDGAVSNARTYTLSDMDKLLEDLQSDDYVWEKGKIKGKGGNKLYLLGLPKN